MTSAEGTADPGIPSRFSVREELPGDGGARLLRARDTVLGREVFLKCPGPALAAAYDDADLRARSLREARTLAGLDHPGIDRLLDVLETPRGPLLVLEPTRGERLEARLAREGRLPADDVIDLGIALADALEAVHRAGVMHRGIAASCIVVGEQGQVRLTGFHFAKPATVELPEARSSLLFEPLPMTGACPQHPAPEQISRGEDDPRSDLFGLGWVLFRALTGEAPYEGTSPLAWGALRDARERAPDAPVGLARTLALCLALSPAERPADAHALRTALEALRPASSVATSPAGVASPPTAAPPPTGDVASPRAVASSTPWAILAAASVVAIAAMLLLAPAARGTADARAASGTRGAALPPDPLARVEGFAPTYARSHALLIGIAGAYEAPGFPVLRNAVRDVEAVERALERDTKSPWEVTRLLEGEATRVAIIQALIDLSRHVADDDRVLIYYAGHGEAPPDSATRGYLIPADAVKGQEPTYVQFREFNQFFEECRAKHVLVVMDCCYSGRLLKPHAARRATSTRHAEVYVTQKAHVTISSGRPNEQVSDGPSGAHSPFADAFVGALREGQGPLTSMKLFTRIDDALQKPEYRQTPMWGHPNGPEEGEYLFLLPEAP